ncbi:MAG: DUF3048 domain-containing protein [Candidatus Limnocylindria bacterium]
MRLLVCFVLVIGACAPLEAMLGSGPATWPLRGTATPDGEAGLRRPIVVKVANDRAARPQAGLAAADVVLEIPVEGGITRLALVFHSEEPGHVGPVRSARSTDVDEAARLHAILVHVGASEAVARQVSAAAGAGGFVQVDEFEHPEAFERISGRVAPYNAFTSAEAARAAAGEGGRDSVNVPALAFGEPPSGGSDGASLVIPYGDPPSVRYEYDAGIGAYHRTHGGADTIDEALGVEVLPENVVVVRTDVTEIAGTSDVAGAPSLEYRATGTGPVTVLRDGRRYEGTWTRGSADMYRFTDAAGAPITLKPGLTWIHIVPESADIGE